MPLFMTTFAYKPEVWAGLIRSPENREEVVGRILEDAGCKLRGLWYAFGEGDGFALIEAPDTKSAAGIAIAIASSGAFRKYETTPLMTQAEALEALQFAAGVHYTTPAEAVPA
ncbi:MAG: GYD domain-containing protein [Thermoleophilia bacterium]|nr:GYD domain-containing protein [Thermoleophilia bacterium]